MSIRAVIVILLAAICGLTAAWGMSQMRSSSTVLLEGDTSPVVVAIAPLSRGRMITEADIQLKRWPKNALCKGLLESTDLAVGRVAVVPIMAGEPVFDTKLAPKGSGRGLATLIPHGMRAYTIRTSRVASNVGGFVLPGNKVDILLTLKGRFNDQTGGGSTITLLQAIEVLAVDQELDAPAENKVDPRQLRSVTLLVTPEQAAVLDLGQSSGSLTLSLRNPDDLVEAVTRPATLNDFRLQQNRNSDTATAAMQQLAQDPAGKQEPPVLRILTILGDQQGEVEIEPRERQGN